MPINYKEYPANWKTEIRPAVMKRAGEVRDANGTIIQEAKCEGCGVLNHAKGARNFKGEWMDEDRINGLNSDSGEFMFQHLKGAFPSITTIVLTVAHLDHDKTNNDVSIDRLRAWCQKCHLSFDMPNHIAKRKKTLKKKKGIIDLFDAEKTDCMNATFEELMKEHLEWTSATFPNRTSKGALIHAHREIDEIIADIDSGAPNPIKAKEYADALFCIIDSAASEGISLPEIIVEGYGKLQTNKVRKWKDNGDGSYSHIKA